MSSERLSRSHPSDEDGSFLQLQLKVKRAQNERSYQLSLIIDLVLLVLALHDLDLCLNHATEYNTLKSGGMHPWSMIKSLEL